MSITKEGTVNELGVSKNGKAKIKIDGKWYFAGRCKIDGVSPGERLQFEASAFGEKGDLWGLDNWAKLPPPVGIQIDPGTPVPKITGNTISPVYTGFDEAQMRFISNCVGQAIAAGTIKQPEDIEKWFAAARSALKSQRGSDDFA